MFRFYNDIVNNIVARRVYLAVLFLFFIFVIGSIGYHFIEGMEFFEGFYMTFITITTIGFGEVKTLSMGGRLFTIAISLLGIGIIAYIASQTTQLLFESQLFRRRTMKKQLEKINNHYIVCGYGRIGHRIAMDLKGADVPVVVVDNRADAIERLEDDQILYVEGNAQEEDTLVDAGVKRADGMICALSRDEDNVFATLIARELNEDLFILVRTNRHQNTKKILRSGANKVISPYEIGADRMANVILRPYVDQFIENIMGGMTQDHVFDEAKVFKGSHLENKTLAESEIRQKYFVVIVGVIPANSEELVFNPGSDHRLKAGDSLIVLGDVDRIEKLRTEGCDDDRSLSERVSEHDFIKKIGQNSPLFKTQA